MKDRETPLKLVRLWSRMLPEAYDTLDDLRRLSRQDGMHWPDYCKLPISAAFTYLVDSCRLSRQEAAGIAAELTACWTWRQNKVIYSFDLDFAQMLAAQADDMEDTGVLPTDLLLHLPYPCIYIKAQIYDGCDGFWCWLEHDINAHRTELRIQYVTADMEHSIPYVLHLLPGKTLRDCILSTAEESGRHMDPDHRPDQIEMDESLQRESMFVLRPMQLILYLLSDRADVESPPKAGTPQKPKSTKPIQDKAGEIKGYDVGVRIGAAIRKYGKAPRAGTTASGSSSPKRPHSRRGHWHHYWIGPRDGDRKLILRWTAPTFIHPDVGDNPDVVIFPVKDK